MYQDDSQMMTVVQYVQGSSGSHFFRMMNPGSNKASEATEVIYSMCSPVSLCSVKAAEFGRMEPKSIKVKNLTT